MFEQMLAQMQVTKVCVMLLLDSIMACHPALGFRMQLRPGQSPWSHILVGRPGNTLYVCKVNNIISLTLLQSEESGEVSQLNN